VRVHCTIRYTRQSGPAFSLGRSPSPHMDSGLQPNVALFTMFQANDNYQKVLEKLR